MTGFEIYVQKNYSDDDAFTSDKPLAEIIEWARQRPLRDLESRQDIRSITITDCATGEVVFPVAS